MMWQDFVRKSDGATEDEAREALRTLPEADAAFFNTTIMPLIAERKIQAIKEVRTRYEMSLRSAKAVIDAIASGATIAPYRYRPDSLIDTIEIVENYLREAIRKAVGDDKTMAALTGIRQQISDLWSDLIELPSPARTDR